MSYINNDDNWHSDESAYVDPANGYLFYFRKNGKTYVVSDVFAIHVEDTMLTFEIMEIDEEGSYDNGYMEQGTDLATIMP
jgi:hypothetical protein